MHSPSIVAVLYSLGLSIHMSRECVGREQSRIGIIIRPMKRSRISIPFISPTYIRDWLVINYGEGGYKMGKLRVRSILCTPSQDRGKLLCPPPFNMAKTSSYHVKTIPNIVCPPPFSTAKTFSAPPLPRGKTSHAPLPFCSPSLPVISDQALISMTLRKV